MTLEPMRNKPMVVKEQWHSIGVSAVFDKLKTSILGLDEIEVQQRRILYGENRLPESKKITLFQIVLHQLVNPLIFILVLSAFASLAIGEGKDAVFIFIVIFINSALGAYQEYNAERSANSLQKLLKINARVKRSGKPIEVDSEQIVPGDIVLLESGMKVPADIRLFEASNLEIDESFLTGESLVVTKQTESLGEDVVVAEQTNMVFTGSTVMKGRGIGVVVSTGIDTQVGIISQKVTKASSAKPPLVHRMEKFIKQITFIIVIICIFLAILLRTQGMDVSAIFFFVVALTVSAIPEGLPVALTVALSIATKRMARKNVIVRKLTSVESLGSCTVIASDKTGTLTVNEQTVKIVSLPDGRKFQITGQGYNGVGKFLNKDRAKIDTIDEADLAELNRISVLANEASLTKTETGWDHFGDAMDIALLGMSYKLDIDPSDAKSQYELIDEIPYESERQFSAAFYKKDIITSIYLKGAVEKVLSFCQNMLLNGKIEKIDIEKITIEAESLAKEGYRVLALASGRYDNKEKELYTDQDIPPLTLYGLVGFIDPLRSEAKGSVEECRKAGIKVIMITGDHPETAFSISKQLGIANIDTPVITGKMLGNAGSSDSKSFRDLVMSSTVFARISPNQKLEIVDVLIKNGEFVAVTGDGVNDAPALKRANIGVAMGSGTDVAKEVSSMIVIDDNFSSIVGGVEEGRHAYNNVRKVVYLLISTGAAEVLLFLLSILLGLPLPLLAVQLLWLNLVTNGIQDISLAFEGGEPGAMNRPPRKTSEGIFNSLMIKQTIVSSMAMTTMAFGLWYWLINYTDMSEFHARNLVLLLMVFMQNFHTFNARSERTSIFRIPLSRNYVLLFGVLTAQFVHIASLHIPFMQNILRVEPVLFLEWIYVLLLAIPMIVVMEVFKKLNKE